MYKETYLYKQTNKQTYLIFNAQSTTVSKAETVTDRKDRERKREYGIPHFTQKTPL